MLWGGYSQRIFGEGDDSFIVAINLPGEFAGWFARVVLISDTIGFQTRTVDILIWRYAT